MRRMRLENEKDEDYKDICIDVRYFPKGFFQVATSQGYFPKWQLPKNVQFTKWQLPKCAIFRAATSQVWPSRSARPRSNLAAALGPLAHSNRSARPPLPPAAPQSLTCGKLPHGKLYIWEVATWENTLGKLPLGKMPLGKYLTPMYRWVG